MEVFSIFSGAETSSVFELIHTIGLGLLLLVFLFAPSLERRFAPWHHTRNEVESKGEIIRAASGVIIIFLLAIWAIWGD